MIPFRSNRVCPAIQQGWVARTILVSFAWAGLLFAAKAQKSLSDFELFKKSVGEWEGIGVSFEIVNGELREPVTFRDRWEAKLNNKGRSMEMRGATQAGGRRIGYVWRFRWNPKGEKITGEFENSEGVSSPVDVTAVAEGKRIEVRTPKTGDSQAGMEMDIYLEDEDIVIESRILDEKGNATYRAAARYRKSES